VLFCAIWLATAVLTRYSSLSALIASVITPLFLLLLGHSALALLSAVLTLLLLYMHRANIQRLRTGTEGKIGQRS
jgi:glycerol-3-phosphate acyltransferase PlsY